MSEELFLDTPAERKERLTILSSLWIVLLLGVPFWWKTTTTERLSLPRAQVAVWQQSAVRLYSLVEIAALINCARLVLSLFRFACMILRICFPQLLLLIAWLMNLLAIQLQPTSPY